MSDKDWDAGFVRTLGMRLAGDLIGDVTERGEPIVGETVLVLMNAHHEAIPFTLPVHRDEQFWERLFDTHENDGAGTAYQGGDVYPLQGRSLAIFRTGAKGEVLHKPGAEPAL